MLRSSISALRIESNQQQQSRYTTSPQSHFCAFDSPRINGIQRTIFVIYSTFRHAHLRQSPGI
jgi:hypothetical protein